MYQEILQNLGLNKNEATIYEFLLKSGQSTAGQVIAATPIKRGVVYNALTDLAHKGLIHEDKSGKVAKFIPNHPSKLRDFAQNKENRLNQAINNLEANLNTLVSDYNLTSGKPGIQFYEGIEGVRKVIEDSLTAKEMIYTYADIEAIEKYASKVNADYVKKREKLGIKKQAIVIDSPFARKELKNYHKEVTDIKFIDHSLYPFHSVMQIYDGKISYLTLSENSMIGVIIADPNLYQLHKSLFEHTWKHAMTIDQLPALSKAQ